MKEITIEVDEKKYNFFLDLLKNFDFVSIKKESRKDTIISIAKGMQSLNWLRRESSKAGL
ncbi:MAG: hypothetical protein M3Z56_03065 [Bacteroidota bacterium]|nr:hypothetical protein [Bacteroidota bacterium]